MPWKGDLKNIRQSYYTKKKHVHFVWFNFWGWQSKYYWFIIKTLCWIAECGPIDVIDVIVSNQVTQNNLVCSKKTDQSNFCYKSNKFIFYLLKQVRQLYHHVRITTPDVPRQFIHLFYVAPPHRPIQRPTPWRHVQNHATTVKNTMVGTNSHITKPPGCLGWYFDTLYSNRNNLDIFN